MRVEGATRFVRLAFGDRAGVPVTILPCRAMTVLRWLLLHFCDVAAAVVCAGGWVLRELLAGFPVAVGGMKGARPARVPCAISFTLLVETLRVPWGCVSFADGFTPRRVLPSAFPCPAP